MSWRRVIKGFTIAEQDLPLFQEICKKHNLEVRRSGSGFIVHDLSEVSRTTKNFELEKLSGQNAYQVIIDNDTNYCSIPVRFGQDAKNLIHEFSVANVKKRYNEQGYRNISATKLENGWTKVEIAVPIAIAGGMR